MAAGREGPVVTAATTSPSPRIAVIGAGMAGILSAVRLAEAGYDDVVVYEKADRAGGTWRENTYPGVACDVPSHLYSYSFAPNAEWSHVFSPGEEICRYLADVAQRRGVHDRIRFGTEITRLEHTGGRWHLEWAGGRDQADVVIAATGVLHHPSYPAIEGLADFAGPCFHSSRWDHSVPLEGARVGVIGTGSTAVQITSAVVGTVAHYSLFQRTAQWIIPVGNRPIPDEDRARYRSDPAAMGALRDELSQMFCESFANAVVDASSPQIKAIEAACLANLEDNVTDPELRARLRPPYRAACKRLIISPDFYQSIQHPNAELVTEPIVRVEQGGVRTADGRLHGLDVLVLATGFRVDRFMRPMTVVGPGGLSLDDLWAQRPSAYLSISIPGFPNLFMLNGPNGPVGNFSLIDVAELQFAYVLQLLEQVDGGRAGQICARAEAARRFEEARVAATRNTVWVTGCNSWYLDDRGVPAVWPWTFDRFRQEMEHPRLEDFELVR